MSRGRIVVLLLLTVVVGVLIDVVVAYSAFPGYGAAIGVGGTLLILVAATALKRSLARPESYYPGDGFPDVQEDQWAAPRGAASRPDRRGGEADG